MKHLLKLYSLVLVLLSCVLTSAGYAENASIQIVEMKTAQNIDEKYRPVNPTSNFKADTSKVYCWFKWKDTQVNSQISAQWTYLTEDIPILDYKIVIPRREGAGGVALSMPEGKKLPAGEYEVTLKTATGATLRSLKFKIEEK